MRQEIDARGEGAALVKKSMLGIAKRMSVKFLRCRLLVLTRAQEAPPLQAGSVATVLVAHLYILVVANVYTSLYKLHASALGDIVPSVVLHGCEIKIVPLIQSLVESDRPKGDR